MKDYTVDQIVTYLTVLFGLGTFICCSGLFFKNPSGSKRKISLEKLISKAFSGSTIPIGCVLVYSGFRPSILNEVKGVELYFAIIGCATIFMAVREVRS